MPLFYEIPLSGAPQRFTIALPDETNAPDGVNGYTLTFQYRDATADQGGGCGWTIDIADAAGNNLLCGVPLITGADLLGQFAYLDLGGHLAVTSDGEPDAVPTFDNLGSGSHLYWVTLP